VETTKDGNCNQRLLTLLLPRSFTAHVAIVTAFEGTAASSSSAGGSSDRIVCAVAAETRCFAGM
jgi:hypothetical protein